MSIDCGCGGASGQKLSMGLALRNLVVMVGLTIAWVAPAKGAVDGVTAIGVICASLALLALYFAANQLMTNFHSFHPASSRSSS
jgi:hypothetical protein